MPIIAPWLRPTDVVGSASSGSQIGLSARAQDLAQAKAAQDAAEQQARLNQQAAQFDVAQQAQADARDQEAYLALRRQSALDDYNRGHLDILRNEAKTKDDAAKYLQNFKPTLQVDPVTGIPYSVDAHGKIDFAPAGYRDRNLPLTVIEKDGQKFYRTSEGGWSHIRGADESAKLPPDAAEALRQSHADETFARANLKKAVEDLPLKSPPTAAQIQRTNDLQHALDYAATTSRIISRNGKLSPINPVMGDSLRARAELPPPMELPGPTEGTGLAPVQPQEGTASTDALLPPSVAPQTGERQFRKQNGIVYEKIGNNWVSVQ